jgi:general stress protein 26
MSFAQPNDMPNSIIDQESSRRAQQNFLDILHRFDRAMLVTHAPAGFHARPMAIADTDEDGSLWFITGADTAKVDELQRDTQVVALMQSSSKWLSVLGRAEVRRDRARIHQLWREAFRVWFSGKDDPNIVLLRLNPTEAEYWDSSGLKGFKFALQFAAAYVTGKEREGIGEDVDQHAKVPLSASSMRDR